MKRYICLSMLLLSQWSIASLHDPEVMWEAESYCTEGAEIVGKEYDIVHQAVKNKWTTEFTAKTLAGMLYGDYPERDDQVFLLKFLFSNIKLSKEEVMGGYYNNCTNYYKRLFKVEES